MSRAVHVVQRPYSDRHPIGFRPPSNQIPSAVRSDCVRSTMTSAALFLDKHLQSLAQCYNFVRRNTNNNIINNLNEKHNYEYQVRNSRHQECQGRGKGTEVCTSLCARTAVGPCTRGRHPGKLLAHESRRACGVQCPARPHGACACQRLALPSPRRGLLLALRRSRRSRRPALRQDARRLYPSAQHPLPSRALVARRGRQRCQLRACRLLLTFAPVHGGAAALAPPPLFRHPHLPHSSRPTAHGRLARERSKEMATASHRHRRAAARRRQQCAGVFVERMSFYVMYKR